EWQTPSFPVSRNVTCTSQQHHRNPERRTSNRGAQAANVIASTKPTAPSCACFCLVVSYIFRVWASSRALAIMVLLAAQLNWRNDEAHGAAGRCAAGPDLDPCGDSCTDGPRDCGRPDGASAPWRHASALQRVHSDHLGDDRSRWKLRNREHARRRCGHGVTRWFCARACPT